MISDPGSMDNCRTKQMTCLRCGEPVTKPFDYHERPYHLECGIAEHRDQITQMRNKSGPYYDRWLLTNGPKGRPKGRGTPLESASLDTFDASIYVRLLPGTMKAAGVGEAAGALSVPGVT